MARNNRPNRPDRPGSLGPSGGGFGGGGQSNGSANANPFSGGGGDGGRRRPDRPNRPRQGQNANPFTAAPDAPIFQDWVQETAGQRPGQMNPNKRKRLRNQYEDAFAAPAAGGDGSDGELSSIFTPEGANASGDEEAFGATAWGLLNQAGIDQEPVFGSQQSEWLDGQINDWYQRWQGQEAIQGEGRPDWSDWLLDMTGGPPPGATPDLNYVKTKWGPAMQQMLARQYQAQSPRNRGTDMRQWVSPRRVIQFLIAAASAATVVADFVSKALQG